MYEKTVTREEFQNMPVKFGGDLWNQWKLWDACFSNADVTKARYKYHSGTGLAQDVELLINGAWIQTRIYG